MRGDIKAGNLSLTRVPQIQMIFDLPQHRESRFRLPPDPLIPFLKQTVSEPIQRVSKLLVEYHQNCEEAGICELLKTEAGLYVRLLILIIMVKFRAKKTLAFSRQGFQA
jgi:hypothetical protein